MCSAIAMVCVCVDSDLYVRESDWFSLNDTSCAIFCKGTGVEVARPTNNYWYNFHLQSSFVVLLDGLIARFVDSVDVV